MRHASGFIKATCAAVALAVIPASAMAATWQQIQSKGVLTVGIEGTYAPFDFVDSQNRITGFDVDLIRAIGKELGVKVKFVTTEWSSLIGGVNADRFDVIAADMSITPERAKSVDFTVPYEANGAVLICRKDDNKYHTLADLKGAKVGTGIGTTYATLAQSVKGANVVTYSSFPQYIADLMNHRLDVIMNAGLVSRYVIKQHNYPLVVCSDILNKDHPDMIGGAVKKGNTSLLNKLNGAITKYVNSPAYTQLYQKWFGEGEPLLLKVQQQKHASK